MLCRLFPLSHIHQTFTEKWGKNREFGLGDKEIILIEGRSLQNVAKLCKDHFSSPFYANKQLLCHFSLSLFLCLFHNNLEFSFSISLKEFARRAQLSCMKMKMRGGRIKIDFYSLIDE
jgi:hypothetical protein